MTAGVIFSLLSAIVLNIGNIIEKHAIVSLPEISVRRTGHLFRTLLGSREWMFGFGLCLVGLGLQVLAFALAPIPVVQSIFNAGIVLLIVLSRIKLRERLQPLEWSGIAVVVIALTFIAVTLGGNEGSIGLLNSGWRLIVALVPTLFLVVGLAAAIRSKVGAGGLLFGLAAGLLYGAAALGTKGASTLVVRHGLWPSIPYVFGSVYPYVFIVCSVLGMLAYQTGLQRHRISVVGSVSDAVCSTYLVAVGMIVFGATLPKDSLSLALRLGGFVGVVLGTVLVAAARPISTQSMPPIESDLGLGPVLQAEVRSIGLPAIDSVSGH